MKAFVIIPAVAVLLIIPLWAGLGYLAIAEEAEAGHHEAVAEEHAIAEFKEAVSHFVAENTRPDGLVQPGLSLEHEEEHEEAEAEMPEEEEEKHQEAEAEQHDEEEDEHEDDEHAELPVAYIEVSQYTYRPGNLVLKQGETYIFRMMATDVSHGGSIHLGTGSYMVRLPVGVAVDVQVTFTEPGEHMLYCTYYCGTGHPFMATKLIVEPAEVHESGPEEMDMEDEQAMPEEKAQESH